MAAMNTRGNTLKILAIAATTATCWWSTMVIGQETRTRVTTEYRSGDDFRMATRWEKTSAVVGRRVVSTTKEEIGKVEDVVVDPRSGRILYGVVSFGPSFGVGEKYYAIPWNSLQIPSDHTTVVLNVDKEQIRNAPSFERGQWPNFADEKYAVTTYKYYHVPPYWEKHERTVTEKSEDGTENVSRDRWYEPAATWQRSTQLIGREVRNKNNEDLGKVADLSIDPETGRILYGVVTYRNRYYSIPWQALDPSNDPYVVVDITPDQLIERVSFEKDRWPNMADERWADETYTYYHVEPYWKTKEYKVKVKKDGKVKIKEKKEKK